MRSLLNVWGARSQGRSVPSCFQRIFFMWPKLLGGFQGPLWQTAKRANARLKATLGGFHGPLTFSIENTSFFHNSFILYPSGRKSTSLIPKNALPRRNSDLFSRCSKKSLFLKNPHCMAWRAGEFGFVYCREREPRKRAAESHQAIKETEGLHV